MLHLLPLVPAGQCIQPFWPMYRDDYCTLIAINHSSLIHIISDHRILTIYNMTLIVLTIILYGHDSKTVNWPSHVRASLHSYPNISYVCTLQLCILIMFVLMWINNLIDWTKSRLSLFIGGVGTPVNTWPHQVRSCPPSRIRGWTGVSDVKTCTETIW